MEELNSNLNERMLEAEISLRNALKDKVPEEILDQLEGTGSDQDCCRILAENGVDLEEIEKIIADHGFDMHKIGLQLQDTELESVSGGFYDSDFEGDVKCPWCNNSDRGNFSRQAWRSFFSRKKSYYRCKSCNQYFAIDGPHTMTTYGTKKEFDDYYNNTYFK